MLAIAKKIVLLGNHPSLRYYAKHPVQLIKNRLNIFLLTIKKYFGKDNNFQDDIRSDVPIDVVICAINKDYNILVHTIDSIRKYIRHPLGNIYIICPLSVKIKAICEQKKCVLVDENSVLTITKKDINFKVGETDRSGWIFQQLLKWGADKFTENDNFLVTEADTVFCRPRVFMHNDRFIFPVSNYLCHIPYFRAINDLIGIKVLPLINLTSHHALYNKKMLQSLKNDIEKHCGMKWYKAIIAKADRNEGSAVSDYESYGQYVLSKYPNKYTLEYWYNVHFGRSDLNRIKYIFKKFGQNHKAISFHSYDE